MQDKKRFFDQLGDDMEKAAKKNDRKNKKLKGDKKGKSYFDDDPFDTPKKKKKKNDKDKKSDKKKKEKNKETEYEDFKKPKKNKKHSDWDPSENQYEGIGSGNLSKKILKQIKSKDLKEAFKRDKVLIDERKFWTKE